MTPRGWNVEPGCMVVTFIADERELFPLPLPLPLPFPLPPPLGALALCLPTPIALIIPERIVSATPRTGGGTEETAAACDVLAAVVDTEAEPPAPLAAGRPGPASAENPTAPA